MGVSTFWAVIKLTKLWKTLEIKRSLRVPDLRLQVTKGVFSLR
jgi:hypothetical protein